MNVFDHFPTLETDRLILRQMTVVDALAVFKLFSDSEVTKDMGIKPFHNLKQAEEMIDFMNDLFQQNKALRWGIIKKDDNMLIGTCGFNGYETVRGSRGEIGYDLRRDHWRHGYMSEALKALITFGFNELELYRIEAYTNVNAIPSMKLLEKLGFQHEGVLRGFAFFHGDFWDQHCFSLLRDEWKL